MSSTWLPSAGARATAHPECARYRLEVTGENRAARLYERMGFRYLDYKQMVIDR